MIVTYNHNVFLVQATEKSFSAANSLAYFVPSVSDEEKKVFVGLTPLCIGVVFCALGRCEDQVGTFS